MSAESTMIHVVRSHVLALGAVVAALALPPCAAQRGFPGGPGGPGGPGAPRDVAVLERFDVDHSGALDADERAAARAWLKENRPQGEPGGPGRRGRPGFPGRRPARDEPAREPTHVSPDEVVAYPDRGLYDQDVVRTIFLTFPQDDWFDECADFYRTDVLVPATMLVDGATYRDVGVGFRGNSSYFGVPGKKKSFAIAVDATHSDQRLLGYKTLNLLNSNDDPSFLREVIHAFVARRFTPALQANLVRLVVNGESWGVYANVQQFNKDFLDDEYGTKKGARWKVPANFQGAGLAFVGDERAAYERAYELKDDGGDADAAWDHLIALCRALEETPDGELEQRLPRLLDIDAALWFLAIDTALLDGDGYSSRASDFLLWEGPDGRFRPLPYDSNEILGAGGGPAGGGRRGFPPGRGGPPGFPPDRGGPPDAGFPPAGGPPPGDLGRRGPGGPGGMMGGASPTSSPLALLDARDRPLARLLTVPAWRAEFLAHVRAIATSALEEKVLGPFCEQLHVQIDPLVRVDEKAVYGYDAFAASLGELRKVVDTRRDTLLKHESMKGPWPTLDASGDCVAREEGNAVLRVRATVACAAPLAAVELHVAERRSGPFVTLAMHDDGQHGDGATGDGVFGAESAPFAATETVYFFVTARTAADVGTVAFAPAGGAGRPIHARLGAR